MDRTQYGELKSTPQWALDLAQRAANKGKIPAAYDWMSWERISSRVGSKLVGTAAHHEIYDISPDCSKTLVCVRHTEGTRYGIKTTSKEYFVVTRHGAHGTKVSPVSKAIAAKAAKLATRPGDAIKYVIAGKLPPEAPRTGYKLLVRTANGYESAWDNSPWQLGKPRIEAATPNHRGGLYSYADINQAIDAASRNDVFGTARDHSRLAIVQCEVYGAQYSHDGGKLCATKIRLLADVASTL